MSTLPSPTARRRTPGTAAGTPASAAAVQSAGGMRLPAVPAAATQPTAAPSFAPSSTARTRTRLRTPFSSVHVLDMAATASPGLSLEHALLPTPPPATATTGGKRPQTKAGPTTHASTARLSRLYSQTATSDGIYGSGTVDLSLYRSAAPFHPRSLPSHLVQSSPVIDYWLHQLAWEQRQDYTNDLAVWESQLSDMLQHSGFDDLMPQRVALVCDLIDQISGHVGRWAPILRRIVRELFASVYQGYEIHDLETTVPIWQLEGASWIGWTQPTFGNALDAADMEAILHAPTFHPLSPLSDPHMYNHGAKAAGAMASLLPAATSQPPPKPKEKQPPRKQYFRSHLWELNQATWLDVMEKYELAQEELVAHRAKVAKDLGMTLTKDGTRIVVAADGPHTQAQAQSIDSEQRDVLSPLFSSISTGAARSMPPLALSEEGPVLALMSGGDSTMAGSTSSSSAHHTSVGVLTAHPPLPRARTTSSMIVAASPGSGLLPSTSKTPRGTSSRFSYGGVNSTTPFAPSGAVPLTPILGSTASPRNADGTLEDRESTRENQRRSIILSAKQAVLMAANTPGSSVASSPSHAAGGASVLPAVSSPRFRPLTAQSMSALQSSSVGSLVEQAMTLSRLEAQQANAAFEKAGFGTKKNAGAHPAEDDGEAEEEEEHKEQSSSPPASARPGSSVTPPPSVTDTEAVTAAAFQTIHSLISTPPIPESSLIAYFDVEKRLNMQYDNLYRRIKNWAQKQSEMQKASSTRDLTLNRICRRLKRTIYWTMFTRWRSVVHERRRQLVVFRRLFTRYHQSAQHLQRVFLGWRIHALLQKTATLDRSVQETATKNLVLQVEIQEQKAIREKEQEKRHQLRVKEQSLSKERDEIKNFLSQCQQQIVDVQGAQVTQFISGTIGMIQQSIGQLWAELKEARAADLQDPCRMVVSSTILTEHVHKPYTHMVEASPEWVHARKDEVKKTRVRLQHMLDSDLLLLWFNYHLAQAHLKVNQEKLQAKFYGKTYKYDAPNSGFPAHVRHFYSSDASLVRRAENFTSSLQDCEVFLRLLGQISPLLCDVDILGHVDLEVRGKKLMKLFDALNHDIASIITPMDLTHSFSPDLTAALIARLMMTHTSLPVDTSAFVQRRKKRSEYAPPEPRLLSHAEQMKVQEAAAMTAELGLSAGAAAKAQDRMREADRADALVAETAAELKLAAHHLGLDGRPGDFQSPSLLSMRDESSIVAASRSRRNSKSAPGHAASLYGHQPTRQEQEEEEARRAVKDCGPFTDVLRALHLVNRELTTRARVEVNLVNHIQGSVKKVLNDVRVLLDDAYERHALWMQVRRRVAAFVSIVMTHQMRGEPLVMQDRKSIRQIRRYTKLLDRAGKPQARFADLLHPLNRTSNDHMLIRKGQIDEEEDDDESDNDDQEVDENGKKVTPTKKGAGGKKPAGDDSDGGSASDSSSSDDGDDSDDGDAADGTRTADGDDVWHAYTPVTARALAAMPKEEADRELRKMKNRNETPEDLLTQMTFELTKMQENIAKHYTSIRDIFRAYAQLDQTTENAFKQREEERTQTNPTTASGKPGDANSIGGMSKTQTKAAREKEDREDPTASIRRKLREQAAASAASAGGSSYSAAAHADANPQFSIHEFWLLVRDTKLLTKRFTVKKCERIFEYVWSRDLKAALTASGHLDVAHPFETLVKDRAKMEVDSRQFVEILLRISHQRMLSQKEREELLAELEVDRDQETERKRAEGMDVATGEISDVARQMDALTRASISIGNLQSQLSHTTAGLNGASMGSNSAFEWGTPLFPSTRPGWALRLFWLIRCKLIPSAARLNVDQFRSQYKRMEVSVLFKKHGAVLRRLFYRYARLHSVRTRTPVDDADDGTPAAVSDAVWTNTIDYREFISLLRDSKILDGRFLMLHQVYSIFANVQADLAKVTPMAQERDAKPTTDKEKEKEKDAKEKVNKRASLLKSGPASGSASVSASRRSSLTAVSKDSSWGAAAGTGPLQTLSDLNLEHQAAATALVPTDEQILASSATSTTELIYPEFLEALAAIGSVRHPNPYKPLHVRVQQFLERDLLPWCALVAQNNKAQQEERGV